jgi:hypothetical protein
MGLEKGKRLPSMSSRTIGFPSIKDKACAKSKLKYLVHIQRDRGLNCTNHFLKREKYPTNQSRKKLFSRFF